MSVKMFNPIDILQKAIDNNFDLSVFKKIDETPFREAPNFLEFITSKEFSDATILPWQVEAGMHLFSEYCTHCSNPDYLTELFDEPLEEIKDNVQLLEHGKCPKCKRTKLDMFTIGEHHPSIPSLKSEFVGCLGQRSGKSKIVAMASAYQLHRWVKIPEPTEYYGLPRMELIMGSFAAMDAGQAEENLWIPFKNLYDNAPWFRKYNDFLMDQQKKLGFPLVAVKDTYISYVHKNIRLDFSGADDRKKRGRTRIWGAIDEIAFFNSDKKVNNKILDADKNYTALNNSLATIRKKAIMRMKKYGDYNVLMPVMYNSSSPKNVQDKIWRLTKGASQNAWCYAVHRATWEANPDYTMEDCRNINQGLNETEFWTDFGAIPPYSDSPYISDARQLLKLCAPTPTPGIMEASREIFIDGMGDRYLTLKANIQKPDKMVPRLLSIDNGYSNNAFSATLFHFESYGKKPVLDFAVNLYPDPDQRLFINFQAIYDNFILPIIQNFRIQNVFYDRWQSLNQIHSLRDLKVDAQAHSLSYEKDFLPFKQTLLSGNFGLPYCGVNMDQVKDHANPLQFLKENPTALLIWQCLTVREVGKKILKPIDGDDDLFRAFILGGSRFSDEKIRKKYDQYQGVAGESGAALGRTYSMGQVASVTPNATNVASPFMSTRTFSRRK